MKSMLFLAACAALSALPPAAAAADHTGHQAAAAPAAAPLSEGTVKKVDKAAGRVTISHGPLVNLGMPGMTMPFAVQDPAWLDKLKPGDRIRFRAEEQSGGYVVVLVEPKK